jgi:transcriptional regulator with XRE-family HTH domain
MGAVVPRRLGSLLQACASCVYRSLTLHTTKGCRMKQTASEVFASRVRQVRMGRSWKQSDLAERLGEIGYDPTDRTTVARTESGGRTVTLDDAVAYSAVLGPSLLAMIGAPLAGNGQISLGPTWHVEPPAFRQWAAGIAPLNEAGEDAFYDYQATKDRGVDRGFAQYVRGQLRWALRCLDNGDVASACVTFTDIGRNYNRYWHDTQRARSRAEQGLSSDDVSEIAGQGNE